MCMTGFGRFEFRAEKERRFAAKKLSLQSVVRWSQQSFFGSISFHRYHHFEDSRRVANRAKKVEAQRVNAARPWMLGTVLNR